MDPIDTEWATCKSDLVEETNTGNVTRSCVWRELGMDPPNQPPNKTVLENVAEDILVQKPLKIRCCDLPGYPRSTFLMVFSPDGTKVASTHGNHNLYVSELASGKHVRILKGHPRTPWCIAFHPSHPQLIGSGCLGGQVRVWDISSGGSEVWNVQNDMVIASIAFHPREQLLVIATFNELYFWDWSQPAPFTKVSTNSINEKVRYVAFDALGYKLITGISVWNTTNSPASSSVLQQNPTSGPNTARRSPSLPLFHASSISVEPFDNATAPSNADDAEPPGTAQDIIVNSYQSLVQRYDSLVRNYQRLVRNRLTSTPPPNTIDRGTDPMETDVLSSSARTGRPAPRTDDASPGPSTSRSEEPEIADSEGSSRLLNLDALSFGNNPTRNEESRERSSVFGSRSSAFQPLNERSFRPVEQGERSRLLPNPFSAAAGATQSRASATDAEPPVSAPAAPAPAPAPASPAPADPAPPEPSTSGAAPPPAATAARAAAPQWPACAVASARASLTTRLRDDIGLPILDMLERRCEQISALGAPGRRPSLRAVDARTITESLDLIRDILRDSGTRLLNLITHMSLSTLAGVPPREPPLHLLSPLRSRDLISDSSDSDSDELELNIRRTRNASFRETASPQPFTAAPTATDRMLFDRASEQARADAGGAGDAADSSGATPPQTSAGSSRATPPRASPASAGATPLRAAPSTSGAAPPRASARSDPGDTPPRSAARVTSRDNERRGPRTDGSHSDDSDAPSPVKKSPRRSAAAERLQNGSPGGTPPPPDPDAPSTSRAPPPRVRPSPVDAYRKVRAGVAALQKHTAQLSALWLRGSRTSMRELRVMWEGLRRRVHLLHREARDGPPPYSRSLLERCMMLPDGGSSRTAGRPARPAARRDAGTATEPEPRRRRAHAPRWRAEDELRRRAPRPVPRAAPRPVTRASSRRGDFARALEMSGTRHVVRVRAMQVLSIMFNMMIMCLEDRGLSQLIITMLRTLKKALALTCLMLVSNRHAGRAPGATSQRLDPTSVVRLQRGDEAGPVNVEEEEPAPAPPGARPAPAPATAPAPGPAQRWSDRLAVQIAAANRNTSLTARSRRDLYLESRRQKALHRTDPTAHPLIRKRGLPPASTYRIPALRSLPPSAVSKLKSARTAAPEPRDEPVAGPSHERDDSEGEAPPSDTMVEFQQRINLIRLAHMQAVRFRDAARHRFRRLQTVRGFSLLRPRTTAEPGPFHTAPTAAAAPLMHVNDLPMSFNADDGPPPPPRLARIHEYLQPIILAQNAMVVDEELDINVRNPSGPTPRRLGAMASLLDASIISEALPAPVHRVQAWDFTTGDTPDIADSTKNVVVLRCKIHNDASIDISKDGRLLVALLPVPRLRSTNHWLGVYSLEWSRLGQCLHTAVLEQSAVSVALSPTARHLAVGLGSRRFTTAPHARNNVFAFLYRLEPYESTSCTGLSPIKELEQNWDQGFTSLNCLRWAPQPGQGLVYANNTGQLIIMS